MEGCQLADNVPTTPWHSERKQIENVVTDEGTTTIEELSFHSCSSLTSSTVPDSITMARTFMFTGVLL